MPISAPLRTIVAACLVATGVLACSDGELGVGPDATVRPDRAGTPGLTIRDAIEAKRRHTPALMRTQGVVGVGVGLDTDGSPVVRVFTQERGVHGIPDHVDDVPVDVKVTGLIVAGATTDRARPAPTGYSVGHPAITAGTIGGRVIGASGQTYIISNNHVIAATNDAQIGDPILQPGPFDGGTDPADRIGTLADFEPIDFTNGGNVMDAAIASVASADVSNETPADGFGVINSTPYPLDGNGDGVVDLAVLGLDVAKYGRTTLLTTGQVTEIDVTTSVCYEVVYIIFPICLQAAQFDDLLGFPGMSQGGDSGSTIVAADGTNRPVALLFAGSDVSTLGSRIDLVLDRFGVSYDDGSGPGNQPPVARFTFDCTDLDCTFDGSGSTDDGSIVSYAWDFGDGGSDTGITTSHAFAASGSYDVTLAVTDDGGITRSQLQEVTVSVAGANEVPTASYTFGCTDLDCTFDASGSTDDGSIVSYEWDFGDGNSDTGVNATHSFAAGGDYDVVLTVTDDGSLQDTDTQTVTVAPAVGGTTFNATVVKEKGNTIVRLTWTNGWTPSYIWRFEGLNTFVSPAQPANGTYDDVLGKGRMSGTYLYSLCETNDTSDLFALCTDPIQIDF